jgi:Mrp family chromosome partitioning ATPase
MSHISDILFGSARPVAPTQPIPDQTSRPSEAPPIGKPARRPITAAPALRGLPSRWALEVQKVAIHLMSDQTQSEPPQVVVFSSLQAGSGTTTVSYLVAHHLAVERGDERVLFVDFSTRSGNPPARGSQRTFRVGEVIDESSVELGDRAFVHVSVRLADERSVAAIARWFREFIDIARKAFGMVVIDCPPFYAEPEAYSLAKASDGVVLVMRTGENRYPAVNALVADLEKLGIQVLGTVLTFRRYPIPGWLLRYI